MKTLQFTITFRGPFHVATGSAGAGMDVTVDRAVALPASSLKGLMRGRAEALLGEDHPLVETIFGGPRFDCPWAWTDAVFDGAPTVDRHARVHLGERGAAAEGELRLGEHVWARTATFAVEPWGAGARSVTDEGALVLRAAARAVSSLGSDRRRGEGWVSIADDAAWTEQDSARLIALLDASSRPAAEEARP